MIDIKEIPIFIISYNRMKDLKKIIISLESKGYNNIIILDNASNDQELLKYLKQLQYKYKVHFLKENYGHMVLWKCGLYDDLINDSYYVLTDNDIIPIEECPNNFLEVFYEILQKNPCKGKCGFSLKIDDLPNEYKYKWDIIRYESFFFRDIIYDDKYTLYNALIDTTFALYRPEKYRKEIKVSFYDAIRVGYPYEARHLTWYVNSEKLTEEQNKYFNDGKKFSTSMNELAIQSFRREVIGWLANMQDSDLYDLIKLMCTKKFIKKNISYKGIIKGFFFLVYRKILLMFKHYNK